MKSLVKISENECILIYGGRNEDIAYFVEKVAQCVGAFARLIYLVSKKSRQCLVMQAENSYPK